jgi:hypothetical protein
MSALTVALTIVLIAAGLTIYGAIMTVISAAGDSGEEEKEEKNGAGCEQCKRLQKRGKGK